MFGQVLTVTEWQYELYTSWASVPSLSLQSCDLSPSLYFLPSYGVFCYYIHS